MAGETWNGNTLNKANTNGYKNCTFGLVIGLSGGTIQYANGVSAPNLFDDGTAIGKTSYDNGQYTLSFDRTGDTYTLSSVGGTSSASNLQTFTSRWNWNKTRKIWSNHFWPMANVKNKDPHTNDGGQTCGMKAKGQIVQACANTVVFTNTTGYELPATGGAGVGWYLGGGLLLLFLGGDLYRRRKSGT